MVVDPPAPIPEVPPVKKLLQQLVTESQSRPSPVVSPSASAGLEQMLRSFLSEQQPTRPPLDSDLSDGIGTVWCVSHVGSQVMLRLIART